MSCQVNLVGNICDIDKIRQFLFFTADEKDLGTESWIQKCLVSVSPVGDIIVLAKDRKIVILSSKWDPQTSSTIFQISYSGTVHEDDNIKSILCLPIVGLSKSSNVLHDWTCILLGFESGYVRAYLETFELIYEELFHSECVVSIKCRSQHSPRSDLSLIIRREEIYLQYQTILCILQGNQFIPILRSNRAHLARVQANSGLPEYNQPVLEVKKWEFQDQTKVKDAAVIGQSVHNTIDHLLAVSTSSGFESRFSSVPSSHTLVLAVGFKPFLGFHYAVEVTNQDVLTDIAKIVALKLKSALPTWLVGSGQSEKNSSLIQHPMQQMGCRFGLCDLKRSANTIVLSSNHNLAAISDNLGRVIILDTTKGIALKILKGYRDAQCSFIQVEDDRISKNSKICKKIALFLVIYSPKKGTIEIFTTQQFLKIATFTASKHSRLVYINYSMMGFSKPTNSKYACQFTTVLLDLDGQIKEIFIPFHFSLDGNSNKKARDIHLYKALRATIKSEDQDDHNLKSSILNTIVEVQTTEMKMIIFELLLKSNNVSINTLLEGTKLILENFGEDSGNEEVNTFKIKANNTVSILNFFVYMQSDEDKHVDNNEMIELQESEIKHLKNFLSTLISVEHLKVRFADENKMSIKESLSIFNLTREGKIKLMTKYDENIVYIFCKDLFAKHNEKCKNLERFKLEVIQSNISAKDLFLLLVTYWVNRPLNDFPNLECDVNNLTNILYVLLKIASGNDSKNSLKYYWEDIREIIFNATKSIAALTAAIACRYIAYKMERDSEKSSADLDFEIWSKDNVQWTMLLGKLEDVSLLNILIMKKPNVTEFCNYTKLNHDVLDISLKFILQRKGSISELVARWLTMSGIDPEMIVYNEKLQDKLSNNPNAEEDDLTIICSKDKLDFLRTEQLFKDFNTIKKHWPFSLDAGMILANMCWEYALEWKKNIQNIDCLEASVACLKRVPNFFVKLGLFNLVWKTHLKLLFENTIQLIHKVGKVPKLKLCIQDTGLSDVDIPKFLDICTDHLDKFTDFVQQMYTVPKTPLKFEPLWEDGGQPLAELAVQQTNLNFDLLLVHYELSLTFMMLCRSGVKVNKPLQNLFDADVIKTFFTDFQEKPEVDFNRTSSTLDDARMKFLKKMISKSIESVTVQDGKPQIGSHSYWMSKYLLLGKIWKLDVDVLGIHENVQLYIHGYDFEAQKKLTAIKDSHTLGRELLVVAGKRMHNYMLKCPTPVAYATCRTYLTPHVTAWIDHLNKDWCADSTLSQILELTKLALYNLKEKTPEHKLCGYFYDGVDYLIGVLDE